MKSSAPLVNPDGDSTDEIESICSHGPDTSMISLSRLQSKSDMDYSDKDPDLMSAKNLHHLILIIIILYY